MVVRLLPDPAFIDLFTLIAAPFWGSFLALYVARWPNGEAVLLGRSRCSACGHALSPFELLPILSWLVQHGRCRRCGARIGFEALLFELGALALAAQVLFLADLHGIAALLATAAGGLLLALAVIDARHLLIPDGASVVLVLLGLIEGATTSAGPALVDRVIGAGVGWMALVAIEAGYRQLRGREGLGRGDAGLFAAAGAWTGWQELPVVLLVASLTGLAFVALRGLHERRLPEAARAIAFGPFLAIGLWLSLLARGSAGDLPG